MSNQEKNNHKPIILSVGRKGTIAYSNDVIENMVNDYSIEKFEKVIEDCCAEIDDIKDDDSACIKRLFENEKKRKRKKGSFIMPQKEAGTGDYFEFNQRSRLQRLCSQIRQLCRNNFDESQSIHVILTFNSERFPQKDFTDLKTVKGELCKFIKRMNNHYDNFRHVSVFGRQENGNWHIHMLCNLKSDTNSEFIAEIWGLGIVKLRFKRNKKAFDRLVDYLCKNLRENFYELVGTKAMSYSKALQKNLKLMSWKKEAAFIINTLIQSDEGKKAYAKLINGETDCYYVNMTIPGYWEDIVMAELKETKFRHKKFRPKKRTRKGGDANVTEKSGKDS